MKQEMKKGIELLIANRLKEKMRVRFREDLSMESFEHSFLADVCNNRPYVALFCYLLMAANDQNTDKIEAIMEKFFYNKDSSFIDFNQTLEDISVKQILKIEKKIQSL